MSDQTKMLTVCVNYEDLRCYHVPGQFWNKLMCEFQLRTNAQQCQLFGLPETFQQSWKVLPAAVPATRPCTSCTNYLLKVAAGKGRKFRRSGRRGPARRSGGCLSPFPAECPCPAYLMSMLLLTWVFPRAQAPFELCLLDSSRLLLLWPSEARLPPCPGSDREYISTQSWVIITNSQQDSSCGKTMEPIEGKGNWLRKIRWSLKLKRKHKEKSRRKLLTYARGLQEREVRYFLPVP